MLLWLVYKTIFSVACDILKGRVYVLFIFLPWNFMMLNKCLISKSHKLLIGPRASFWYLSHVITTTLSSYNFVTNQGTDSYCASDFDVWFKRLNQKIAYRAGAWCVY